MVKETALYDLLNLQPTAEAADIKKGYRRMALKYHPDKNSEPGAEDMFKKISEAYQILSDPNERKIYDERGMSGIDASKQGGGAEAAKEMFRSVFGGDNFLDIFGELDIIESVLDMFDENLAGMTEEEQKAKLAEKEKKAAEAAEAKKEKIATMAQKLVAKCDQYVAGDEKGFRAVITAEANELAEVPGGSGLVELIGHIYVQEAKQHLKRFFGLEGFFSELGEKKNTIGNILSLATAMAGTQAAATKMQEDETNLAHQDQLQKQAVNMIWRLGKFEISGTLRSICEKAMTDKSIPEAKQNKITLGIELIGEIYERVAAQTKREENAILAAIANGTIDNLFIPKFRLYIKTAEKEEVSLREIDMEKPDELLASFKRLRNVTLEVPAGTEVLRWELGLVARKDVSQAVVKVQVHPIMDSSWLSEGVARTPHAFVARLPKLEMKDEVQRVPGIVFDRRLPNRTVDAGRNYRLEVTVQVGERRVEKFECKFILKKAESIEGAPSKKL